MAIPFVSKWEVSSLRWNHGSFVEAAKVRPLQPMAVGDFWVERPVADLKPAHLARLQRRWWLASQLASPAWPVVVDAGDDGGSPWAVIESPGRRMDGTYPFTDPQLALAAVRGLALAVAEAEAVLAAHQTSPHLSIRASSLGRDEAGRLRFHLATLDPEVDAGIPATPNTWMWTAEELLGQPESARSNVFALGWLAALMLTGRSPWGPAAEGQTERQRRETLKPLIAQGKFVLLLPAAAKALEPVLKKACAANPSQRFPTSAAFAEALAAFAPGAPPTRPPSPVQLPVPPLDPRFECLATARETKLLSANDDSPLWAELTAELDRVHSPRAKWMRGDESAKAAVTPTLTGEKLELTWRHGYVRALTAQPGPEKVADGEARVLELCALLQHPSLRFMNDLTLAGSLAHARLWLEALQRAAPPGLKRVTTTSIAASDPFAVDIAFRFPKWTWVWGQVSSSSSFLRRLFGK